MKTEVFKDYSYYYDLFYRDKDYGAEVDYIDGLIRKYNPGAESILDLGCGTGRHGRLLAEKGYRVHGVDMSETMLESARKLAVDKDLTFSNGDIRTIRLDEKFDVVCSLFHVINYQVTDDDLRCAFETARQHLNPEGLFIFDCWYGPAVLHQLPEIRVRFYDDEMCEVTRKAHPVHFPQENRVDVNYHLTVRDKTTQSIREFDECHSMRYLFADEVRELFENAEMEMLFSNSWMTEEDCSEESWSACFGGKI